MGNKFREFPNTIQRHLKSVCLASEYNHVVRLLIQFATSPKTLRRETFSVSYLVYLSSVQCFILKEQLFDDRILIDFLSLS